MNAASAYLETAGRGPIKTTIRHIYWLASPLQVIQNTATQSQLAQVPPLGVLLLRARLQLRLGVWPLLLLLRLLLNWAAAVWVRPGQSTRRP